MDRPGVEFSLPGFVRGIAAHFGDRELVVLGEGWLSDAAAERESARLARGLLAVRLTGESPGAR